MTDEELSRFNQDLIDHNDRYFARKRARTSNNNEFNNELLESSDSYQSQNLSRTTDNVDSPSSISQDPSN
jgi:hypothetical protein